MRVGKRFALVAAGVLVGAGVVALPAAVFAPAEPESVPVSAEEVAPAVAPADAGAAEADPAPTVMPEPVEVVKPDGPVVAPSAPTPEPVEEAVYVPSTNDCGEGAYRIEPGTCEWVVPGDDGVELPYCESEDSKFCFWDAELQGNGVGRSFVDAGDVTYYLP